MSGECGLRQDEALRGETRLFLNTGFNAAYALFSGVCGIVLRSSWMGALAGCYLLLSVMRLMLLRGRGDNGMRNWRRCLVCGRLLLVFAAVFLWMSVLLQTGGKVIAYPSHLIYGVAAYAFYALISAVVKTLRLRKQRQPILLADAVLSLTKALISMYSLQCALITRFGNDPDFFRLMGALTGETIMILILCLSVGLARYAKRRMKASEQ